jgi:CsoR family transcriptional regulator, copper-sensing transcriptional repressor
MSETVSPTRGYTEEKDLVLKRLARIEGQVRGVARMVEDDRYCIDVLQQLSAVQGALDKVGLKLLDDHVKHCMVEGADDQERLREMTAEMMDAVGRLVRR